MNRRLAHLLIYLYPHRWRDRYGEEFETVLHEHRGGVGATFDIIRGALKEHVLSSSQLSSHGRTFGALALKPSALIPVAMSLAALSVVLGHIAMYGVAREADEGAAAHIWQLLMAGQVPVLLFFAIKWLPQAPRPTLYVLVIQVGAVLASMAPVFFFNL
ncbi:MAG TPA: hypothetical protein VGG85_11340 [Terracidiphilus sp.]|jgi:hypothetical protein